VARLGVNNLSQVLMQALMNEGILMKDLIDKKLMTFGTNGVSFFKALGRVLFIFDGWVLHSMGVHYMVHKTNLVVRTLLHLQMVNKIEGLL
jgi:hypothetical protein